MNMLINLIKKSALALPVLLIAMSASAQRPSIVSREGRQQLINNHNERQQQSAAPAAERPATQSRPAQTWNNSNRGNAQSRTVPQILGDTRTSQSYQNANRNNTFRQPSVNNNGYYNNRSGYNSNRSNYYGNHSGYYNRGRYNGGYYNYGAGNRYYYGGAYHSYPTYYRPFNQPTFGVSINVLPRGYYRGSYNRSRYYYYGGNFYRPYGSSYQIIQAPLGAYVPLLPSDAYPITYNNLNYYEYSGTYYRPLNSGYEVVGINGYLKDDLPAMNDNDDEGDIISDESISNGTDALPLTSLPENFKTVTLNNVTYFVSPSGEYYTKHINEKGETSYRVAASTLPGK